MIENFSNPPAPLDNKRVLILWSGGVDSTALLVNRLLQGWRVDVLAVDGWQGMRKIQHELVARALLMQALHETPDDDLRKAARENLNIQNVTELKSLAQLGQWNKNVSFQQAAPWFVAALMEFNHDRHSHIEIAYVLGDEIGPVLYNLHEAAQHLGMVLKGHPVGLYFPYAFTRKERLYQSLQKHFIDPYSPKKLWELAWVCETPVTIGHCGKCKPCKREREILEWLEYKAREPAPLNDPYLNVWHRDERVGTADANFHRDWLVKELEASGVKIDGLTATPEISVTEVKVSDLKASPDGEFVNVLDKVERLLGQAAEVIGGDDVVENTERADDQTEVLFAERRSRDCVDEDPAGDAAVDGVEADIAEGSSTGCAAGA